MLETKKNFVRFISHEVRTPLNSLTMALKLIKQQLQRAVPVDDILDNVFQAEEACEVAVETLNELLCFEKLDAGLMKLDREPVDALSFIESCVRLFELPVRHYLREYIPPPISPPFLP